MFSWAEDEKSPVWLVSLPDYFCGDRLSFPKFKAQAAFYIALNKYCFPTERDELLFISSYLQGPAFRWIQPHLHQYCSRNDHSRSFSPMANPVFGHGIDGFWRCLEAAINEIEPSTHFQPPSHPVNELYNERDYFQPMHSVRTPDSFSDFHPSPITT